MIHNQARDARDTRRERWATRVSRSFESRRLHFACCPISPILETAHSLTAQKLNYMVFSVPGHRGPVTRKSRNFSGTFRVTHLYLYLQSERRLEAWNFAVILLFIPLYNKWKDKLCRIRGSQFYEWLFGTEKFSGLSSNGPQVPTTLMRKRKWSYRKLFWFSENWPATFARPWCDGAKQRVKGRSWLWCDSPPSNKFLRFVDLIFVFNYPFGALIDGFGHQTVYI